MHTLVMLYFIWVYTVGIKGKRSKYIYIALNRIFLECCFCCFCLSKTYMRYTCTYIWVSTRDFDTYRTGEQTHCVYAQWRINKRKCVYVCRGMLRPKFRSLVPLDTSAVALILRICGSLNLFYCQIIYWYTVRWRPSYLAERDHLGNFGRGDNEEYSCEIILNFDQCFGRCRLKIFLIDSSDD